MNGILAKKLGMTQVFTEQGERVPASIRIDASFVDADARRVRWRGEGDSNSRGDSPPVFKTGAVGQLGYLRSICTYASFV